MTADLLSLVDIEAAHQRIKSNIVRTPLIYHEPFSQRFGAKLHFKAENLQHVGAFKARGALNAVLMLDDATASQGVVTHSSGNHAAALARAAKVREISAHVVMPDNSAKNKIAAVRSYGIEPIFCEPDAESREETAEKVRLETGATLVHPYDDPHVMAGQGTVGLEILEQLPNVETIIVPVGGGGLLAGILTAVKSSRSDIKVIAAEPELADDTARSLRSGQREDPLRYDTVADGLRTPVGENTFPIIRRLVDDIILVSEREIRSAMRAMAVSARLVVEPSGAVGFAALASAHERFAGQQVAMVLTGGNLDFGDYQLGHDVGENV